MITLNSITIKNFKSTDDQTYTFPYKKNLISGPNGVGKTTIMDAYFWAITGKTSKNRKDGFEPRIKEETQAGQMKGNIDISKEIFVEVNLDVDGRNLIIRRTKTNKKGKGMEHWEYSVNGQSKVCSQKQEFNLDLKTHFGIDVETFLFLSSPEICWDNSTEKNDIKDLIYTLVAPFVANDIKAIPLPEDYLDLSFDQELATINEIRAEMNATSNEIKVLENTIAGQTLSLNVGANDRATLSKQLDLQNAEIKKIDDKINGLENNISAWNNEIQKMKTKYELEVKQKNNLALQHEKFVIQVNNIIKQIDELKNQKPTLKQNIINKLSSQNSQDKETKVKHQQSRIEMLKSEYNKKYPNGVCPTCAQKVASLNLDKEIELLNQLQNNSFNLNDPSTQILIETMYQNDLITIDTKIHSLTQEYNTIVAQSNTVQEQYQNLNVIEPNPNTIKNYETQINTTYSLINESKEQKNKLLQEVVSLSDQIKKYDNKIQNEERLKSLKEGLERLTLNENMLTNHLEKSIQITTDYINSRMNNTQVRLYKYSKATNQLIKEFTFFEKVNYATANEMNNGAKLKSSFEFTNLLQTLSNSRFPIWLDETSRLSDLNDINSESQIILLEALRNNDEQNLRIVSLS